MIDVKQAVTSAVGFASDLLGGRALADLALEEVEMSKNGRLWLITLGYNKPQTPRQSRLDAIIPPPEPRREFKTFQVDAVSGKVLSMKIRKV